MTLVEQDPVASAAVRSSRNRVLDMLREAGAPVGVQEVAARTHLHANTARFHLDGLVDAGLAERHAEERTQPGRPRIVFTASPTSEPGRPNYRLLAEMLTGLIADSLPRPEEAALKTGALWGRYLSQGPPPLQRVDAPEGISRLVAVLAEAGFAPDSVADLHAPVIQLRHCPFREVAALNPEVVCSLHLGLMRGVLSEVRAPLTAVRLEPFVEPSLCLAHLATT